MTRKATAIMKVTDNKRSPFHHIAYDFDGHVCGERRSQHTYAYAIGRRVNWLDGTQGVIIDRWSNSPRCKSTQFALPVE
jgi:hypothetical protein